MGNFNKLPEDIILNILTRLLADSALECKLVSKPWKNLVQLPYFSQMHLNHLDSAGDSGKLGLTLFTKGIAKEPVYYTEYDENLNSFSRTTRVNLRPPFEVHHSIQGSCNGLICFNACKNGTKLPLQPAYICNPITREYIVLPKVEGIHLLTGFGYCHLTNEYKVVSICNTKEDPSFGMVQVYTLGSGVGWRNVGKMEYDMTAGRQRQGVFANGAIQWLSGENEIVAFDLATEEFRVIPPSPGSRRGGVLPCFVGICGWGDFLYARYKYDYAEGWDIWVLKKGKNNQDVIWSKDFSNLNVQPIIFTISGGLLCYNHDRNVHHYAPKASSCTMLGNFGEKLEFGVLHKNTFVSLKALGEQDTQLMDSGESKLMDSGESVEALRGRLKSAIISQRNSRKKQVSR